MVKIENNTCRMYPFDVVEGTIHGFIEEDGELMAKIDQIKVIITRGLKNELKDLIGQKIGIMRTNIDTKPFIWRFAC